MGKKEMSQEDFIVKEKKAEVLDRVEVPISVPSAYIKIKLSSCGKLTAPAVLHFRNYSMNEAYDLARMTVDNQDEIIITILNALVFEDFDCGKLHREEVKEIMLNIFKAYWGVNLESLQYYVNEDLSDDLKDRNENKSIASIPITNIDIKDILPKFKEPFFLTGKDKKIGFVLPRIENSIIAKNYLEEIFATLESKFSRIKYHLEFNKTAPPDRQKDIDFKELQELKKYNRLKMTEKLRVLQGLMLHSIDGTVIETLKDKYEKASEFDLRMWEKFNIMVEDQLSFGVTPDVKFICSVAKKEIQRRFQFRELDLIPPLDRNRDSEYTLSFS